MPYLRTKEDYRRYRETLKAEFIAAYGGKCACLGCPETDPVFLCVDHVAGGGVREYQVRMRPNGKRGPVTTTRQVMARAKRDGWPPTYQVLCWNCNSAKHVLGSLENCPHNQGDE